MMVALAWQFGAGWFQYLAAIASRFEGGNRDEAQLLRTVSAYALIRVVKYETLITKILQTS